MVDRTPQDLETLSQCWWPLPVLFLVDAKAPKDLSNIALRFLVVIKSWVDEAEESK